MSFTDEFADFGLVTVLVQPRTGSGAKGNTYGPEVEDTVFVTDDRKLVRDTSGKEVVSETTLVADPASAAKYPTGSLVKVGGRTATVIKSGLHAIGDSDVDHVSVVLT